MTRYLIILKVSFLALKKNLGRFVLTLTGIALMIALMTCVFLGKDTSLTYLTKVAQHHTGKAHVTIFGLNKAEQDTISNQRHVTASALSVDRGLSLLDQAPKPEKPFLSLKEYSPNYLDWSPLQLTEGRFPKTAHEVVLSQNLLADGSTLKLGDEISVDTFRRQLTNKGRNKTVFPFLDFIIEPGQTLDLPQKFGVFPANDPFHDQHEETRIPTNFQATYTVVGFIQPTSFEEGSAFYSAITVNPDLAETAETANLSLILDHDTMPNDFLYQLRKDGKSLEVNEILMTVSGLTTGSSVSKIFFLMQGFFVSLIMVVAVVLIANIFQLSYEDRASYLSLLTSIGATRSQRRISVYLEAFCLFLLALPLGIGAGFGLILLGLGLIKSNLVNLVSLGGPELTALRVDLRVSPSNLLLTALVSLLTILLAASGPARQLTKLSPMDGLKKRQTLTLDKVNKRRWLSSSAMSKKLPKTTRALNHLMAKRFIRLQGHKSRSIVTALVAFMVVLAVTSYTGQLTREVFRHRISDVRGPQLKLGTGADYKQFIPLSNANPDTVTQLTADIKAVAGADQVVESQMERYFGVTQDSILSQEVAEKQDLILRQYLAPEELEEWKSQGVTPNSSVGILGLDQASFEKILTASGGQVSDQDYPVILYNTMELTTKNMMVAGRHAKDFAFYQINQATNLTAGDQFPLGLWQAMENDKPVYKWLDLDIVGLTNGQDLKGILSGGDESVWLITTLDTLDKIRQESRPEIAQPERVLSFKLNLEQADQQAFWEQLQNLPKDDFVVIDGELVEDGLKTQLEQVLTVVLVSFIILTSLISLLNLFSSTSGLMASRRQELAMLASQGMSIKQLRQLVTLELLLLFGQSLLWGLPIIGLLIWGTTQAVMSQIGGFTPSFPFSVLLVIIGVGLLVVLLARLSFGQLTKRPLIDYLKQERG